MPKKKHISDPYKYIDPDYTYSDPKTGVLRNLANISEMATDVLNENLYVYLL